MTRRFLLLMLVAGLVIAVLGAGAASAKDGRASVNLYERTDDGSWSIVDDGAWGKLRYWPNGDAYDFKFKGYGLEKWTDYTLIYYPDPWPGDGLVCLGEDYSNRRGKVHIRDWIEPENLPLPMADDENFPDGAKIWLVLSADVKCDTQGSPSGSSICIRRILTLGRRSTVPGASSTTGTTATSTGSASEHSSW